MPLKLCLCFAASKKLKENTLMPKETQATGLKGWIGYRPEIKVLDVTVRDGGLMNDHKFNHDFVRAVYQANVAAGVDYMEMGYKASKKMHARDKFGCWKFCDEDDMRRVASYIHQIPSALDMIKDAHDKGYETTINLMAVSTVPEIELDGALEVLCKSEVGT